MADIFRAAESGNLRALRKWIRQGTDPNSQTRSTKATPLIWSARKRHTACVKLLLKHGAALDTQDASGCTALHYACRQQDDNITNLLMAAGAELSVKDARGQTPMQAAPYRFFKKHVTDYYDTTVAENLRQQAIAEAQAAVVEMQIREAKCAIRAAQADLNRQARTKSEGKFIAHVKDGERQCIEEAAQSLQPVKEQYTELHRQVHSERLLVVQRTQRLADIESLYVTKGEALDKRSDLLEASCEAIEDEIQELKEGLAAKTGILAPIKHFRNDEQIQEMCIAGLLSLVLADESEETHTALLAERCPRLIRSICARFPDNKALRRDGKKIIDILDAFTEATKMSFPDED